MQSGGHQGTRKDGIPLTTRRRKIRNAIIKFAMGGERRKYAWRERGRSSYEVLVAELLLKRTTATAVARIYWTILKNFPTVQRLNSASVEKIADSLAPIGLQWQRAKSIKALASWLVKEEKGQVPSELGKLLKVPGLGEYSARAIMSFAYNIPVAVVDSNVIRIISRVFANSLGKDRPLSLYQRITDDLMSTQKHRDFNLGMLDLGALVCRPANPLCLKCPLNRICDYFLATLRPQSTASKDVSLAKPETSIKVRTWRKEKEYSLVELAKKAHVSKLTIINIESGRTRPKRETLSKLASALRIRIRDLK